MQLATERVILMYHKITANLASTLYSNIIRLLKNCVQFLFISEDFHEPPRPIHGDVAFCGAKLVTTTVRNYTISLAEQLNPLAQDFFF